MRIHCLENVDKSLFFLSGLNVHLENVGAHDIVDGNARITLGLIWTIILRFQIQDIAVATVVDGLGRPVVDGLGRPVGERRYSKDALLLWCQMKTAGYKNVDVQNFTTSWRDGLAFNALIHRHRPDLVQFEKLSPNTPLQNLESAFLVAERKLGIARLFDPEDIYVEQPDEKSIITYVATYYHYFSKLKSEAVRARRAANFVGFLIHAQDVAAWYEKSTSDLLKWIFKKISWLDTRDYPPYVSELQRLLIEFKEYRLQEKAQKLEEKGDIEMDLFMLQAKMRSVQMLVYKPPVGVQVAQVNRAWSILEKSEHARELSLREEIMRQERLMHLYLRFKRKAELRESWIFDNQKLLEQPDHAEDLLMLEAALKKHEALETDVSAYSDRIQTVRQIADELLSNGFHEAAEVTSTRDRIESLWHCFLDGMRERFLRLQNKLNFFKRFSEYDHFNTVITSLQEKVRSSEYGDHLIAVIDLLQRHELIETDIRSLHRSLSQVFSSTQNILQNPSTLGSNGIALAEEAQKQNNAIRDAYMELVAQAEKRRNLLELSKLRWEMMFELDEQEYFIGERLEYLKHQSIKNGSNVDSHFKRHKITELELDSHRSILSRILQRSSDLCDQQCPGADELLSKMLKVKMLWEKLVQVAADCKQMLIFGRELHCFISSCDDAETWIKDKLEACDALLKKAVKSESLGMTESLLRRHHEVMQAVENFVSTIEQLRIQCTELVDFSYQSSEEFPEFDELQSVSRSSSGTSRKTVESRLDQVTRLYEQLLRVIKETEGEICDALSLHQLFRLAGTVYNYLVDKEEYLRVLISRDFETVETSQIMSEPDRLQRLDLIKRRFTNLEVQLGEIAEKVAHINQVANDFLEGPKGGDFSLRDGVNNVNRILNMQNHLNARWNRLADAMDEARDRLNQDSLQSDLVAECQFTLDWITDKEHQLSEFAAMSPQNVEEMSYVQSLLRNLQNDMTAIEARIEDIDPRIQKLMHEKQRRTDSGTIDSETRSQYQSVNTLLTQYSQLTQRWLNLKASVKSKLDELAADGRSPDFVERLDKFQAWLDELKIHLLCGEFPNDLQDTERGLLAQDRYLREVDDNELELQDLLRTGYKLAREQYDPSHLQLERRLADMEDEWKAVKEALLERGVLLRKRYSQQYFFGEASLLDVILNQQMAFLTKLEIPTTLDAVHDVQRQHEAFCSSMSTCERRIENLLEFGRKVAQEDSANRDRILSECSSIENKCEANKNKADELTLELEKTSKLYEFFYEAEDLEDWIRDKKEEIRLLQKRIPKLTYERIGSLEQDIETNRDRGDKVISIGQTLTEDYPELENEVQTRLDRIHTLWDELVSLVHDLSTQTQQVQQKKILTEEMQKTMVWLNDRMREVDQRDGAQQLIPDPSCITSLQQSLNARAKEIKQLTEHQSYLDKLRDAVDHTESPDRKHEIEVSVKHLETGLSQLKTRLDEERNRLQRLKDASQMYLDLSLEATWVREKCAQIRLIPESMTTSLQPSNLFTGQHLLQIQRLRRQLKSHQLETDNRRPRMKILCETAERNYCGDRRKASLEGQAKKFVDVIEEIRGNWSTLECELNRLRNELETLELICKFALDIREIEAWILEQELYVQAVEPPKNEQTANSMLRQHLSRMTTIGQWQAQINELRNRGRLILSQLSQLRSDGASITDKQKSIAQHADKFEQIIQSGQSRVQRTFADLVELSNDRKLLLVFGVSKYKLILEISDLEAWIAEKSVIAGSHEVGNDIDQCCALRDRFLNFTRVTVPDGTGRVALANDQCVRLITQGHPGAADIAAAKDSVNEAWADLLELIGTREQLLKAAWDMHHFVGDCQNVEECINFRLKNLPEAPSSALISGQKQGLSTIQRTHANLEQEIACFSEQISRLSNKARQLFPRYASTQAEQLQARYDRVQATWQHLCALAADRKGLLDTAGQIHRFLITAKELIMWLEAARDQMEAKERPRDVSGVEALINDHSILHNELEARSKSIESCLDLGRSLLQLDPPSTDPSHPLTGPRSEVRERCVQLATGHLLVQELWRERWDRLHLLLEVRQFARDSASAEAWLAGKELQLEVARRQLGETLSETLTLLGAHYAFEQTLVTANERFNALKRLTTLEIRAMEWKPEEVTVREQEKRDKIRDVVKEFLPQYIKSHPKPSETCSPQPPRPSVVPPRIQPSPQPRPPTTKVTTGLMTQLSSTPAPRQVPTIPPVSQEHTGVPSAEKAKVPTDKRQVSSAKMVLKPKPAAPPLSVTREVTHHLTSESIIPIESSSRDPRRTSAPEPTTRESSDNNGGLLSDQRKPSDGETQPPQTRRSSKSPLQEESSRKTIPADIDIVGSGRSREFTPRSTPSSSAGSRGTQLSRSSSERTNRTGVISSKGPSAVQQASPLSHQRRGDSVSTSSSSRSRFTVGSLMGSQEPGSVSQSSISRTQISGEQLIGSIPRLEGPVVRKHEVDVGGVPRTKSAGRSWVPLYMVLDRGQLFVYKDYRSRRQKPDETLRNEPPINLVSATAQPAADYTKRPCVFRLRLSDGREYLIQTANDRVLQRWTDAINDAAEKMTMAQTVRHGSQPTTTLPDPDYQTGSLGPGSPSISGRRRSLKTFFSLRRKP
ncbi:hypothetical protein CRM22_002912 [Opisthorchis felineus]|nr:hypothetical protein CRM22_002912 [Opisthorchis felineus]